MLAAVTAFAPTACGGDGYREGPADTVEATSYEWVTEASLNNTDVPDSSEISDYPGEHKIDLVAWNTTGSGNFATYESSNDVVSPEIERITGVSINKEELRDNRGNTAEARFNNFLTTGNLPGHRFRQRVAGYRGGVGSDRPRRGILPDDHGAHAGRRVGRRQRQRRRGGQDLRHTVRPRQRQPVHHRSVRAGG